MSKFKRILVSHDLQVGGETATESALTIADRYGAELKLVHVVEPYHLSQRLSHLFTPPYSQQDLVQKAERKMAIKLRILRPPVCQWNMKYVRANRLWNSFVRVASGKPTSSSLVAPPPEPRLFSEALARESCARLRCRFL